MRMPWRRDTAEADAALAKSTTDLERANSLWAQARQVAADLRRVEERNGLIEAIQYQFSGGTS